MKKTLRFMLMVALALFAGQAFAEDIIWQEDWSSYAKDEVPSDKNGLYSQTDGGGTTKIYEENLAGGISPELLVAKKDKDGVPGTFVATIQLNGASGELFLSYKANQAGLDVTSGDAEVGEATKSGYTYIRTITVPAGTAVITLTFAARTTKNVRFDDIKLYQGTAKKPAGLSWGKASTTLTLGEEVALTLSNENNLPVTFTSSDETVATIDASGVVTLVAAGKTTLTASFDGNEEYEAQSVSIEVTVKEAGGGTPTPQPGDEVKEVSVAEALAIIDTLANNAKTGIEYKVKGYVVSVTEISTEHGNATFTMADEKGGSAVLTIYRSKGFNGENITIADFVKVNDLVEVQGKLQKYFKDEVTTPELAQGGKIISINGETGGTPTPQPGELTGKGTLESPYTAADANIVAGLLAQGATSTEDYYIKGKIASIKYVFTADHGTAHFYISDDGTETNTFFVYSTLYLGNRQWVEGDTQIAVGDDVIIYGKVANYNGTLETASRQSYIYSLNGVTDGGTPAGEEPMKVGSISRLIAAGANAEGNKLANVELTLTDAKVLFNDGNYIYVREGDAAICFFKVTAVNDLFKDNAVVSGTIRVDYEVYNLLPEVKSNASTTAETLTVTESEEAAVPTQTTLANVDEGTNVCDLVTLTATLVRKQVYKTDESGAVQKDDNGNPVVKTTEYFLQDEEAEIKVANNGKNLGKIADKGTTTTSETGAESTVKDVTVTGVVNTYTSNKITVFQIKLTKDAETAGGDVNGDGSVDVADISNIITIMAAGTNDKAADVNGDGVVDVADISAVITIMAGK